MRERERERERERGKKRERAIRIVESQNNEGNRERHQKHAPFLWSHMRTDIHPP
jgi:hypothetical protein